MDFVDENIGRANWCSIVIRDRAACNAVTDGRAAGWVRQQYGEALIALNNCIASNVEDDCLAGFAVCEVYGA